MSRPLLVGYLAGTLVGVAIGAAVLVPSLREEHAATRHAMARADSLARVLAARVPADSVWFNGADTTRAYHLNVVQ